MKEEFRYIINEWLARKLPEIVVRDVKIDLNADKVIAIAGVRRAGKTYLLFDTIKKLAKTGVPRENILYINFDDDRLMNLTSSDLDDILSAYHELALPKKDANIFLFLDEIQNVGNWELWIRRTYDSKKYRIFITGSSSKLLSREIATSLVGRNITYVLYPFSFREFLSAKSIKQGKYLPYGEERHKVNSLAKEYITNGGFPETAFEADSETKKKTISAYYDAILYRDIISRYRIEDANRLEMVFRYAINTYSSSFSTIKLYNYFKSQNLGISRQTINNFVRFGEQTFLFYPLLQFFKGFKRSNQSRKKLYVVDNGIISLLISNLEYGKLLENVVLIELLRRKERNPSMGINYLTNKEGEVDFVVSEGGLVTELIQVTYELDQKNMERELRPLISAMKELKPKRSVLVTFNAVDKAMAVERDIETLTFVQWALSKSNGGL
jgi:predicted AAA+ superfamily ATPase